MAVDDLLVKLAKMFSKPKLQTVFLMNNYDVTIVVPKVMGVYSVFHLDAASIKGGETCRLVQVREENMVVSDSSC